MTLVDLCPLPREDLDWLFDVATPYHIELAPNTQPPAKAEFERWWEDPQHAVHLITASTERAGAAMIRADDTDGLVLSEFFVLPHLRGNGIGARAAALCFARNPGRWHLGVAKALPGTARFWDRLLPSLGGVSELARCPPMSPYQCYSYTFKMDPTQ